MEGIKIHNLFHYKYLDVHHHLGLPGHCSTFSCILVCTDFIFCTVTRWKTNSPLKYLHVCVSVKLDCEDGLMSAVFAWQWDIYVRSVRLQCHT